MSAWATSNRRCSRRRSPDHARALRGRGRCDRRHRRRNGIGRALARAAAEAGARVVVCDVDEAAMAALSDVPGLRPGASTSPTMRGMFATLGAVERDFGRIDGLVCAAAIQPRSVVHEMDPAEWDRVLRINLSGVVWCYQAVVAGMIARRSGSIIAFTSGLAHQGWPGASAYAASKAALIAFAKSAAKEIAQHRVRFNLIAPGVIDTAAVSRSQCRGGRCALARLGRCRPAGGCRRPAAFPVVRPGDDDRFDHQPGLRLCGAGHAER